MAMYQPYQQFLRMIKDKHKFTKDDYYSHMLTNSQHILSDIKERGQKAVSADLNMPQPKLSNIVHILEATQRPTIKFTADIVQALSIAPDKRWVIRNDSDNLNLEINRDSLQELSWSINTIYCLLKGLDPILVSDWRCYGEPES